MLPGEMASKRGGHACVAAQGLLYALGGFDSTQAIPHCEVFDPRVSRDLSLTLPADGSPSGVMSHSLPACPCQMSTCGQLAHPLPACRNQKNCFIMRKTLA